MKGFPSPWKFGGIVALFVFGIVLRILVLPAVSADMRWFLLPWYDFLKTHGPQGLGISFSNYTPPYLYLLWLATLTSNYLPEIIAIKLISICADIVNAALVFQLVRLKYPTGPKPLWASALFWVLPTIVLNSSLWGQADALYILFLLVCLYFILTDRPLLGVLAFGIAFTFKAQAIFILPLLIILCFKRRIAWQYFLLLPLVYILLCLPAILLGRHWIDTLTIYMSQASTYHDLSKNASNLYIFMNSFPYDLGVTIGLIVTVVAISCWIGFNVRAKGELNRSTILFMSLVSVGLVPFLLPKMLDRYFYPADVFSLVAAFYLPELWFVPILYQLISISAYLVSLFDAPILLIQIAAVINTITICFLVWKQFRTYNVRTLLTTDY